jgi:hypothetical protein
MIVKIFPPKADRTLGAVTYNTSKIDKNRAELTKVANFGPLQAFHTLRPQDYINYLQMINNQNKNIKKPQFHVVISAKQKLYDKSALTHIGEKWMKEMGYANQPYLIVFHKDTVHNHIHIVSTRVDKEGKKISSAYEYLRSQKSMNKVLGYDFAFGYRFSTRAQFLMLLENQGYLGRDPDEQKIQERIGRYVPDKTRASVIRQIFGRHRGQPGFENILREKYAIDLVFHSSEGKKPYGYSIIDHQGKQVFKGSEVMPLKSLSILREAADSNELSPGSGRVDTTYIPPVWIADDVDDQQILGMKRRRQKTARVNRRS